MVISLKVKKIILLPYMSEEVCTVYRQIFKTKNFFFKFHGNKCHKCPTLCIIMWKMFACLIFKVVYRSSKNVKILCLENLALPGGRSVQLRTIAWNGI